QAAESTAERPGGRVVFVRHGGASFLPLLAGVVCGGRFCDRAVSLRRGDRTLDAEGLLQLLVGVVDGLHGLGGAARVGGAAPGSVGVPAAEDRGGVVWGPGRFGRLGFGPRRGAGLAGRVVEGLIAAAAAERGGQFGPGVLLAGGAGEAYLAWVGSLALAVALG